MNNDYTNNIISPDCTTNQKRLRSCMNSKNKEHSGVAPLKGIYGITYSEPFANPAYLTNQFSSVCNSGTKATRKLPIPTKQWATSKQ